jgi:RNA polymerase sigma-70 factor (ECF subfamily)
MDDKILIQKVNDGDLAALRILVEKHKNLIWHIIISMTGRNSSSEDLFQEVFLRVMKGIRSFRSDARLSTWMGTITHHVCVDYLRKKKREAVFQDSEAELRPLSLMASDWKNKENEDINRLLLEAITRLPADFRTVITLYHLDEHSYKDIAEITGMPEGTVKSYISRGRNQLREMLTAIIPDLAEIMNDM